MKVIQLRGTTGDDVVIDLHPQVTLIRGLDPTRRAWLIDVLGRLAGGRNLPATGELEAHGILFDLHDETLAVLGLDDSVPSVVTAADLPGHNPARDAAARHLAEANRRRDESAAQLAARRATMTAALAERDAAGEALDELARGEGAARTAIAAAGAERSRLEFELQSARDERGRHEDRLAESVTAREAVVEERNLAAHRLEAAHYRRREAMAEATQAAAQLEEARSGADPSSDPTIEASRARDRLAVAAGAAAEADPDGGDSPLSRRLADLERRRVELARLEAAMGEGKSAPVARALDDYLGASSEAVPVVAALALADTWRDLHQQISALDAGVSPAELEAESLVMNARQSVLAAESDFNQPVLTSEQITKVEAAHTAVLEAQDRSNARFGGSRARKRLEEARGYERRVLERLGFSNYGEYMMSSSSYDAMPANRVVLDRARAGQLSAEDVLAALPGAGDRRRRRAALLSRRDAVAPRVADLLGYEPTGPEVEEELRSLREPLAGDEVALDALARRLVDAGVDVGEGPYEWEDLVLLGRAYLAEERSAEVQRADIFAALAALDQAVDSLRDARSRGATDLPDAPPLPPLAEPIAAPETAFSAATADVDALTLREARWAEVEAARLASAEAEAAVARHREASGRLEELEQVLAERTAAEAKAAADVAEAETILGPELEGRTVEAVTLVSEAEAALARARANEGEVSTQITGQQGLSGAEPLLVAAEGRVGAAERALSEAAAAEQATAGVLAEAEAALATAVQAEEQAAAAAAALDRASLTDATEWELLSRLARVRSVGPGGSIPLVLDDPFAVLDDTEVVTVLDHLALLGGAVQLVVVSDRPVIATWAAGLSADRVLVRAG